MAARINTVSLHHNFAGDQTIALSLAMLITNSFFAAGFALLNTITVVLTSPLSSRYSPYAVKDEHNVPPQWSKTGSPLPDHLIKLHIGLRQSQFGELERHLYEGTVAS